MRTSSSHYQYGYYIQFPLLIGSCPNRYAWSASIKHSQQGKSMTFHSSGVRVQDRIYQGYLYPYNPTIQYQIYDLVQHSLLRLESNIQGSNFERMQGLPSHDLLPEVFKNNSCETFGENIS